MTQSALKNVKYVLESHVVVQNDVNLTLTEAINRSFVRLGDLETPSGDAKEKIHLSLEEDEENE